MDGLKSQHKMVTIVLLLCLLSPVSVKADFDFTVRFYEYWNPTGLCAECGTNGVPVCCDDPQRTENCVNTLVLRCDTRFRFIQRAFNASLETAPNMDDEFPDISGHNNENHAIFSTGADGWFKKINPVTRTNTSTWTGRIQFFVDAYDRINNNQAPNETEGIIDRFLINLDQLQLGADLTEQTIYTGIHNISQVAMSFRVECSENYYGSDCTTFCEAVEGVYNCDSDGKIVCVEENRDPSTNCSQCLPGRDLNTNCTQYPCLSGPCKNGATCTPHDTTGDYQCQCAEGYEGMNCESEVSEEPQPESSNVALIGGVAGGVAGVLLIILLALVVMVVCLTLQLRRHRQGELAVSGNDFSREQVKMNSFSNNTGGSADHYFDNALYSSSSGDTGKKPAMESEYSQLQHKVKTETNQHSKQTTPYIANGRSGSLPKLEAAEQPMYDTAHHHTGISAQPVYDTANHPSSGTSNYDTAYPKQGAYDDVIGLESKQPQPNLPVYSTADIPPPSNIYSDITDDHLQSSRPPRALYDSADIQPSGMSQPQPSIYDDTITSPLQPQPLHTYDYASTAETQKAPHERQSSSPKNLPMYESADIPLAPVETTQPGPSIYDDTVTSPKQPLHTYDYASTQDTRASPPDKQASNAKNLPVYDYADTSISVSLPKEQLTYDYADKPIHVSLPSESTLADLGGSLPTHSYAQLDKPVYTNTTPGKISEESTSHYDLGQ